MARRAEVSGGPRRPLLTIQGWVWVLLPTSSGVDQLECFMF
jgi:hypothetical protein